MINKIFSLAVIIFLFLCIFSCRKNLTGSAISVQVNTNNDTIKNLRIYTKCTALADPSIGSPIYFEYLGDGKYLVDLNKINSSSECLMIVGTVIGNQDSIGTTNVNIKAFFTEHGNIVGFQEIGWARPHGSRDFYYDLRTDTYIE
jgi:hypothetical protein